jgi:hypothetical protein
MEYETISRELSHSFKWHVKRLAQLRSLALPAARIPEATIALRCNDSLPEMLAGVQFYSSHQILLFSTIIC